MSKINKAKLHVQENNNILEWFNNNFQKSDVAKSSITLKFIFEHYKEKEILSIPIRNRKYITYGLFISIFENQLSNNNDKTYIFKNIELIDKSIIYISKKSISNKIYKNKLLESKKLTKLQ